MCEQQANDPSTPHTAPSPPISPHTDTPPTNRGLQAGTVCMCVCVCVCVCNSERSQLCLACCRFTCAWMYLLTHCKSYHPHTHTHTHQHPPTPTPTPTLASRPPSSSPSPPACRDTHTIYTHTAPALVQGELSSRRVVAISCGTLEFQGVGCYGYIYTYTYMYIYVYMYISYMYVRMYVCTYVCMYVRTYVCMVIQCVTAE